MPDAQRLLTIVEAQIALRDKPAPPPEVDKDPKEIAPPLDVRGRLPPPIDGDGVNLIRIYEIDFQRPPKVSVSPEAIRLLIENYGTSKLIPDSAAGRAALFRVEPIEIVRLMFELRARDVYPHIKVLSEPWSLNLFRQRVHDAWLMNTCATTRCHGGPNAGRFVLHSRQHRDERVRYTNLLILERLDVNPRWALVNYQEPVMSLIIQYGLPRHVARNPHPDVPGWKPVFTGRDQRLLQESVRWIESMMQPRPVYPVEYEPPQPPPSPATPPPARRKGR